MSNVLRIMILTVIGVALFFIGLAAGLMSDSDVRPPLIEYIDRPFPVEVSVPGPRVRVPAPFAIADEALGAYRVNGYVTFRGLTRFSVHRQTMVCFPLGG